MAAEINPARAICASCYEKEDKLEQEHWNHIRKIGSGGPSWACPPSCITRTLWTPGRLKNPKRALSVMEEVLDDPEWNDEQKGMIQLNEKQIPYLLVEPDAQLIFNVSGDGENWNYWVTEPLL